MCFFPAITHPSTTKESAVKNLGPCHIHLSEGQAVPATVLVHGLPVCADCAEEKEEEEDVPRTPENSPFAKRRQDLVKDHIADYHTGIRKCPRTLNSLLGLKPGDEGGFSDSYLAEWDKQIALGEPARQRELDRKVAKHMSHYLANDWLCPRTWNACLSETSVGRFDAEYIAAWDRLCVLRRRYIFAVKGVAK